MKNLPYVLKILPILSLFFITIAKGQAPQLFNYQGIARDASGNPLPNRTLALKLSVLPASDAAVPEYEETHLVKTNAFGLYNIQIGTGKPIKGSMKMVNWETGNKYIQVAIDPDGGTEYSIMGTSQLLSVPYALFANRAGLAKEVEHEKTRAGSVSTAAAGTGTVNYLTKFTAANTIYNSQLFDNGTSIGLGTSTPNSQSKLHVLTNSGNIEHIRMQNLDGNAFGKFMLYNDVSSNYATFTKYGSTYPGGYSGISFMYPYANMLAFGNNFGPFLLANNGNVGIGIVSGGITNLKFNAVQATGYLGIGGNAVPTANIHFNNSQTGDTIRITNAGTGHTNNDGLEIGNSGTAAFIQNREGGQLTLGVNSIPAIVTLTPTGNTELSGQIKIAGGAPGVGKVLTSDFAGLATWQTPAVPLNGKSILNGIGGPGAIVSSNGDFYLNTATSYLYGPKTGGSWNDSILLIGPPGATGATGLTGATGPIGPTGATGAQGNSGLNGTTIVSGATAPGVMDGSDGDYFIDTVSHNIYGPKTLGAWGNPTALTGPTGPQGVSGLNGNTVLSGATVPTVNDGSDGDYFMDTVSHSIYGPKTLGAWGNPTALTGPTGPQGVSGLNGNTVLSGATVPTVNDGSDGDYFIDTITHNFYGPKTLGAWGNPTALTGPTGPQGISGTNGNTVLSGGTAPGVLDGNDGDYFIDTIAHNIYGPKALGVWNNPTALTGPTGPQGVSGTNGNTVLSGGTAPGVLDGNDGDYFIDTIAHNIYGPKALGVWNNPTALTGPTGPQGVSGTNGNTVLSGGTAPGVLDGNDGDYFIDTIAHNIYGPKALGVWNNPTALTGPTGPQGIGGANGNTLLSGGTAPGVLDGNDGDYFIDTIAHNIYGPKALGVWNNPTALTGPQGISGLNGTTIVSGSTAPGVLDGNDGDYFMDTIAHYIYGPKILGVWNNPTALTGPTGPQGVNGTNGNTLLSGSTAPGVLDGNDGDYFIDTIAHNIYGPKALGVWNNPTALIGPAGPIGPAGTDAQYEGTWADIASLKVQGLLTPGNVYKITDLQNIELVAKTVNTFHKIPYKRTIQGIEYDDELFDFDTKVITGIDNIGCSARCTNGVWGIMNDASHEPYKMTTASNNLMVHFGKTYEKVISASTDLDEAYSGSNFMIDCGASVSFSYITVWFYKTTIVNNTFQKTQMTLQEASISGANVFIMVKMSKRIQL